MQKALDDLDGHRGALLETEAELEIRLAGDFIFVNETRLRLELDNYASFSHILTMLRAFEIGVLRVHPASNRREWQVFLGLLLGPAERARAEEPFEELQRAAGGRRRHGSRSSAQPQQETTTTAQAQGGRPSGPTRRASR